MMAFPQIVHNRISSRFRVFVGDQLGKFRRGVENHPRVVFEWTERFAPLGRLIHMPCHGDAAVWRFVILGKLPLAGHANGTQLNRTPIRIELLELLLGGKQTDFIETILNRFLGLQHGAAQRQGDLDGDRISTLANNLGGHDISSVKTSRPGSTRTTGPGLGNPSEHRFDDRRTKYPIHPAVSTSFYASTPGLEDLKGFNQLQTLDLSYATVSDAGLEHLKGLTQLQELWLNGTQVTDEGVKKLQQVLPKCLISH